MDYKKIENENILELLKEYNFPNQKIGVIAHVENDKGEILLQQRGSKSRDYNYLYEDIGGKVEENDFNFRDAIIREIREEAGVDITISVDKAIGIYHRSNKEVNWVFIVYFVRYISGEFKIMEKDKCLSYKFFTYEDLMSSKSVTESCKFLSKSIQEDN